MTEVRQSAFTNATQRKLTAMRVTAYSLASLFMIFMVTRALWVTYGQMEAEANRSVQSAAVALATGDMTPVGTRAMLDAIAPAGVVLRHDLTGFAVNANMGSSRENRVVDLARGKGRLVATIDHDVIWQGAWRANFAFIGFILALGLPVIVIFLYMGWLINRPALQLLAFAQADQGEVGTPPKLPAIWTSVLTKLKQLKDSQAQMQAFLDHAPIGMSFLNVNGRIEMMNRYGAAYYGESPEALVGKHMADFLAFYPDGRNRTEPLLTGPLTRGETTTVETPFRAATGEELIFRITSFPVLGDRGTVDLVGTYFVNVTEQRRAEIDLEESRASLQAFFDNLPGLAFLSSLDGTIIAANAYLAEHFGMAKMRPEFLIGKNGAALLPASWSANTEKAVRINADEGKAFSFETTIDRPDGVRHVSASRFPIRNLEGEVTHVGGLVFDRTQEKMAAEQVAASRESLHQAEKLAALGSMLAGVSHELNNPLAAVIGQAALLGEDLEGTAHADRIAKIRRAADRCARIVQSFLAMARQKAPEYRSVNVNDQVRAAAELTEYQMRAANVTLDLRLQTGLPSIAADPDQLHQVIVNLLTNARQALESEADGRLIIVTTTCAQAMVTLSVADNGPGIDPAARQRIFDPFFTTKDVGSGTGIGLSFSLGIVEAHGGTITIEEAPTGSVFVVRLPIQDADAAEVAPEQATAATGRGRVLVVDDEADVADTLADMLGRLGLDVSVAIGGKAGQAMLADRAHFDLILSDIRMPDIDGPALYAWIDAHRPDLIGAVAFVTGDTMSSHVADFLARARCPVLEKPFTPDGLRALVAAMLGQQEGENP